MGGVEGGLKTLESFRECKKSGRVFEGIQKVDSDVGGCKRCVCEFLT